MSSSLTSPTASDAGSSSAAAATQIVSSTKLCELASQGRLCSHIPCLWHLFSGALGRGFLAGYATRSLFMLGISLFSPKLWGTAEGRAKLLSNCFGDDSVKFGSFVGGMGFLHKITLYLMRRMRGCDDAWNNAVAGGVSGLALVLDNPDRRTTLALYLFTRAAYEFITLKGRQQNITAPPNTLVGIFSLIQVPIIYSLMYAPKALASNYLNFVAGMGQVPTNVNEQIFMREELGMPTPANGLIEHGCNILHPHDKDCTPGHLRCFATGLLRAARMYVPVHFIPALIYHGDAAAKNPVSFVTRAATRVWWSSVFLSAYTTIAKQTVCVLRRHYGYDHRSHALIGGFLAGSSLFFEYPSRHLELLLFCIPRSMEAVLNLLGSTSPAIEALLPRLMVLMFCAGMAAAHYVLRIDPTQMRSVNRGILNFLFGATN